MRKKYNKHGDFVNSVQYAEFLGWLQIEFSALARQCLLHRIPTQDKLASDVLALLQERSEKQVKIQWQFSLAAARTKLNRHYDKIYAKNSQYRET